MSADTAEQRRAAYAARVNVHPVCRIRTNGPVPADCARCEMIAAYRDRREQYRDELEDVDAEVARRIRRERPVTFGWWLKVWQYPAPSDTPDANDDTTHLDAWRSTA